MAPVKAIPSLLLPSKYASVNHQPLFPRKESVMNPKMIFTAMLLIFCSTTGAAQDNLPIQESAYYPLKVGNKWHYRTGDQKVTVRVDKVEVVEIKKNGKAEKVPCHRLVVTKDDREKTECVAVYDDGIHRFAGDS